MVSDCLGLGWCGECGFAVSSAPQWPSLGGYTGLEWPGVGRITWQGVGVEEWIAKGVGAVGYS